jgi:hypothetical protein
VSSVGATTPSIDLAFQRRQTAVDDWGPDGLYHNFTLEEPNRVEGSLRDSTLPALLSSFPDTPARISLLACVINTPRSGLLSTFPTHRCCDCRRSLISDYSNPFWTKPARGLNCTTSLTGRSALANPQRPALPSADCGIDGVIQNVRFTLMPDLSADLDLVRSPPIASDWIGRDESISFPAFSSA